eukprot:6360761-Pyramimonas_sp.AAC.1
MQPAGSALGSERTAGVPREPPEHRPDLSCPDTQYATRIVLTRSSTRKKQLRNPPALSLAPRRN